MVKYENIKKPTLEPITVIQMHLVEVSLEEGKPRYSIEPEFKSWCNLHTNFFLNRYHQGEGEHWTKNETITTNIGLAGQKAFEMLLQKLECAYVPNDPIIDQRLEKDYDFLIPQLGKIEVKSLDHYCRKVLIKESEWHSNDFLVVWQFPTDKRKELRMIGWLTQEEVEAYPIILSSLRLSVGNCQTTR